MSEMEPSEIRPAQTFLEAWWAFLRCEFVRPRGGDAAERAADRKASLAHLRLTDDQATSFQLFGVLALISGPLIVSIVFHDWFVQHNLLIGKSSGNWQGFVAVVALLLLSHAMVSLGMALIWLRIRQPQSSRSR